MKNSFILFFLCLFLSVGVFTACNKKDDEPEPTPDECAISTFPPSNGTASVVFKNYTSDPNGDGIIDVNAAAGDYLSIAVEITKGSNRPQKLRVYSTGCANVKGTQEKLAGQSKVANDGTIDLRNTDDAQLRTVLYQVPTGFSTLYLNFEVDESGSKFTYKRIKLNISGSGIIDSYSNILLGAQGNNEASRMSSGNGQTYKACSAAQNLEYIDITYSESGAPAKPYFSSNPARFQSPISLSNSNPTGCGDGDESSTVWSTDGGTNTYFKDVSAYISSAQFASATETTMDTIAFSTTQYVVIGGSNKVYAFKNSIGGTSKKGLILVNTSGYAPGSGSGSINVNVKVQR